MNWHTHSPKSSWKVMFWCWSHLLVHLECARSSRWLPQRWLQLCSTSPHPTTWGPLLYHTRWKVKDGAHCLLLSLSPSSSSSPSSPSLLCVPLSSSTGRPALSLQEGFHHVVGRSVYWGVPPGVVTEWCLRILASVSYPKCSSIWIGIYRRLFFQLGVRGLSCQSQDTIADRMYSVCWNVCQLQGMLPL